MSTINSFTELEIAIKNEADIQVSNGGIWVDCDTCQFTVIGLTEAVKQKKLRVKPVEHYNINVKVLKGEFINPTFFNELEVNIGSHEMGEPEHWRPIANLADRGRVRVKR